MVGALASTAASVPGQETRVLPAMLHGDKLEAGIDNRSNSASSKCLSQDPPKVKRFHSMVSKLGT